MTDEKYLHEWRAPADFNISEMSREDIEAEIAKAEKQIADLDKTIAEIHYQSWRQKLAEWADLPAHQRGDPPDMPVDAALHVAEMTDEQKAAREQWLSEMIDSAAKIVTSWGLK